MATQADVRRLLLALPNTAEREDRFAFSIHHRGKERPLAWVWMERVSPKKARVPNPGVVVVRLAELDEKEHLLAADPEIFFTDPHYAGHPSVLVRLGKIGVPRLKVLLAEAWRAQAPAALLKELAEAKARKAAK
jgi:hypothetical protein